MHSKTIQRFFIAGLASAILFGCGPSSPEPTSGSVAGTSTTGDSSVPPPTDTSASPKSELDSKLANKTLGSQGTASTTRVPEPGAPVDGRKPKNGEEVAVLDTAKGRIILMFFPDKAPKHVENFKKLVKTGFYDGTRFHRVIDGFMIQGGDPNTKTEDRSTWGQGGPGWNVNAEFNDVHHAKGILSMARSSDPNSAGSQFFIMVGDAPSLDNQYTAFGKVVSGQDVADDIVSQPAGGPQGDQANDPVKIKKATLQKWPVK